MLEPARAKTMFSGGHLVCFLDLIMRYRFSECNTGERPHMIPPQFQQAKVARKIRSLEVGLL